MIRDLKKKIIVFSIVLFAVYLVFFLYILNSHVETPTDSPKTMEPTKKPEEVFTRGLDAWRRYYGDPVETLKRYFNNHAREHNRNAWIFKQSKKYPSVPYHIIDPNKEPNVTIVDFKIPDIIEVEKKRVADLLKHRPKLASMWKKCFPYTLVDTVSMLSNGIFVRTGDITAMWNRDSCGQVVQYLHLSHDPEIQAFFESLIRKHNQNLLYNPYASAYGWKKRPNDPDIKTARSMFTRQHDYELDSICFPIELAYKYWKYSGKTNMFDEEWKKVVKMVLNVIIVEQHHKELSFYRYAEIGKHDGLWASPVNYTGMSWTDARPSDERSKYGYLIPSNIMAVKICEQIEEIFTKIYKHKKISHIARVLKSEIEGGIEKYAIKEHKGKKVYAFEVDGLGNYVLMDDANIPSLLSIPYFNYTPSFDPQNTIYKNTRKFVLSKDNPYYYEGKVAKGIGSDHIQGKKVWHLALSAQGITTDDPKEILEIAQMFEKSDAGTDLTHESFDVNNPSDFTRTGFAWSNSMFSLFILRNLDILSKKN